MPIINLFLLTSKFTLYYLFGNMNVDPVNIFFLTSWQNVKFFQRIVLGRPCIIKQLSFLVSKCTPALCTALSELGSCGTDTFLSLVKSPSSTLIPEGFTCASINWYLCFLGSQKFKVSEKCVCSQNKLLN